MLVLKSYSNERLERLKSRKSYSQEYERYLINLILASNNQIDSPAIEDAINFAKKIPYIHPGLNSNLYFLHPLRVASMVSNIESESKVSNIIIALLHNLFEVSTLQFSDLVKQFNSEIAEVVDILTVDRSLQAFDEYKIKYYGRINSNKKAALVKIFDKLDNLFLLCLNPDEKIRNDYLNEVEKYLLPLVRDNQNNLLSYFEGLVEDCKVIGFLDSTKSIQLFDHDYA